jgi:hypothetical protein
MEELLLWKYVENVEDDEPDFNEILRPYFEVLQSGLKRQPVFGRRGRVHFIRLPFT